MTILAIDTSTNHGSVALLVDGVLLLDESFTADRSHSAILFNVLQRAIALVPRPEQIAIGLGPGSYAGIRIAIAAAIGLELGTGAKLIGLPSVAGFEVPAAAYHAIGDARRDAFYYTRVDDGACVEGPLLLSEAELRERIAAHPTLPIFTTEALPLFPTAQVALPAAARLAQLAALGRSVVATGDLEPIYLREPHITQAKKR